MRFRNLLCAVFLASCLSSAALASDWEEEPKRAPIGGGGQDTIILDDPAPRENKAGGGGTMLQGSATAIHTRPTRPPSYSALAAENAARYAELQRLDAQASEFLQQARINVVTPASVFRSFVEKNHPDFLLSAQNNEKRLLLVKGQWDDSSKPLKSLGIKYSSIKTRMLDDVNLDACKVMIIDCAGEIPRSALQKIRNFVNAGGYLLSTDWTLQNVLERAFPGMVQWNGDNTEGVITDAYVIEPDPMLMKGLEGRIFTWKLDRMSQCVRILSPSRVHIIARSSKLARLDPQFRALSDPLTAGVLALEFSFGRGKVLHLVGHFDNCSNSFRPLLLPDPAAGAGISLRQSFACNFILEALTKSAEPAQPQR